MALLLVRMPADWCFSIDQWQARYGRRPQFYAHSFVRLNGHRADRLIDPQVDLAATPLSLWGRNDWFLPRIE